MRAGRLTEHLLCLPCNSHCLLQVAISVLTDTTGAKRGMGKQQFLDHLADSLTASEQVMAPRRCCSAAAAGAAAAAAAAAAAYCNLLQFIAVDCARGVVLGLICQGTGLF
jgi:hypothetical protein